MSASVNGQPVRTHEKSLPDATQTLPKKGARMSIDEKDSLFLALAGASRAAVREAMRRADYTQKSMAIDNKVSEGNVGDALSGSRNLPWAWVFVAAKKNKSFAFHLVAVIAESLDVNQDAEANEFADICGRMVKMALQREARFSRRTA